MALIKYIDYLDNEFEVQVENGSTVMQGAINNMIEGIVAECGGCCSCATCHCYIDEQWVNTVGEAGDMEKEMLECANAPQANSRLSCQIKVSDALDGLIVHLPESQY